MSTHLATTTPSTTSPAAPPPSPMLQGAGGPMRTTTTTTTAKARKPACPYRKERWHNNMKRTPWTEEAKALVTKAIDIGILRFDLVSQEVGEEREEVHDEYNDDGELVKRTTTKTFPYTHRHGQAATFHAWEFRTLDDNVDDKGPDKYRAFYVETRPDGTKNYVSKWVSYSKDLLYQSKDALKAHCSPSFFYHPPTSERGGVWFCDEITFEPWIYAATIARVDRKANEQGAEIARLDAVEAQRRERLLVLQEQERALERQRIAQLAVEQADAARRTALMTQLRQTHHVSDEDEQWYFETFQERLQEAVDKAILSEHNDRVKLEYARFPAYSIAKAPDLVDARLVILERYLLDVIAAVIDKTVEAFRANGLHPVSDATKYTAKAKTRLSIPQVGECVTLFVRTQPSKAAKADISNETGAIAWSLLFDPDSNVRTAVNTELLHAGYQKAVLKGAEQVQVTSINTLRGALNGLWKDVFTNLTKEGAYGWDVPRKTNEDGDPNLAFTARLPRIDFSDISEI